MIVLLADASCVAAQNCSPVVPAGSTPDNPGYESRVNEWLQAEASKPPWKRKARLACMPMDVYDSNSNSIDLMHYDYPAAAGTRAFSFGGEWRPGYAASRGRWASGNGASGPMAAIGDKIGLGSQLRQRSMSSDSAPSAWLLSSHSSGPLMGPLARYRGVALHRIEGPDLKLSLPPILGGSWRCNSTSDSGAFRFRPVCRMECADESRVPVDVGLEHQAVAAEGLSSVRREWLLVASCARVWYSYWTGYPGLRQVLPHGRHDELHAGIVASFGSR